MLSMLMDSRLGRIPRVSGPYSDVQRLQRKKGQNIQARLLQLCGEPCYQYVNIEATIGKVSKSLEGNIQKKL